MNGGTTTVPLLAEGVPVPAGTRHNHKPWLNILPAVSCAWRGEAGKLWAHGTFRKAETFCKAQGRIIVAARSLI